MMEKMNESYEELKRVEHLIYVSLKYTRTVDVIINILNRMVDGYALMTDALIMYAKESGKILSEPESAIERAVLVKQVFSGDEVVVDNMDLYLLLRKLLRAKSVDRENEYRRHVTMKTVIEGREEIVNIDIITNYCLYQREFFSHVRGIIEGKSAIETRQQEAAQPEAPSWMRPVQDTEREDEEEITRQSRPASPPPPPTRQPLKVRPVTAPPRKRAPRPKKYKIQIPKGKNPILQPMYTPALRAAIEEERRKKEAAAKLAAKPVRKAKPAKSSKPAKKAKPKPAAKAKKKR
ncbi:TPA: hypothetical protein HA251_05550 [Candidatus Woesearchaeota archaeon]|nr:hypothetical protein [Candidatus Woesearchaeota archaeon]